MDWPIVEDFFSYIDINVEDEDLSYSIVKDLEREGLTWRLLGEDHILLRFPEFYDLMPKNREFKDKTYYNLPSVAMYEYLDIPGNPIRRTILTNELYPIRDPDFDNLFRVEGSIAYSRDTHSLRISKRYLSLSSISDILEYSKAEGSNKFLLEELYRSLAIVRMRGLLSYSLHKTLREWLKDKEYSREVKGVVGG